jgi:uncharacterized protein YunC (DUF1805 family)
MKGSNSLLTVPSDHLWVMCGGLAIEALPLDCLVELHIEI